MSPQAPPGRRPSNFTLGVLGAAQLARLRMHEGWNEVQIREFQDRELRRLVAHAVAHVPYYRELFRERGLAPSDIQGAGDLARLPILTRGPLLEPAESLRSELAPREGLVRNSTSGSTAERITVLHDSRDFILSWSFWAYCLLRSGGRVTDQYAMLVYRAKQTPRRKAFFEKLGLFQVNELDMHDPPGRTLELLESLRPDVLYGHPSTLHLVAHEARERGTAFRPRLVLTHGEVLMPETRVILRETLRCEVRNTYGACEAFRIACECAHGRLHVLPDAAIVDVDPESTDTDGSADVLITPLYLRTMPLIRYRLGDRVILSKDLCPCGSRFQGIQEIAGRSDDWITLPGGRVLTARHIRVNRAGRVPGALQIRLVQHAEDDFELLVMPGPGYGAETERQMEAIVLEALAPSIVRLRITPVDAFPRRGAGKHRTVVSEIGLRTSRRVP